MCRNIEHRGASFGNGAVTFEKEGKYAGFIAEVSVFTAGFGHSE